MGLVMELSVGQRATRSKTVTADDVKTFAELTGDYNPLHFGYPCLLCRGAEQLGIALDSSIVPMGRDSSE